MGSLCLVAGQGQGFDQAFDFTGLAAQRGVGRGGGPQFGPQLAVPGRGRRGAGPAAIRQFVLDAAGPEDRSFLPGGEPARALIEFFERADRRSGALRRPSSPAEMSLAPSPARPEPVASRPAPAAASEIPLRSRPTPLAARSSLSPRRVSRRGLDFAFAGQQFVAALAQRRHPAVDLARADHRLHGGVGADPALGSAQRCSGARSVIGPRSVAATRMNGASQPAPIALSIVSASWRAWLEVGSCEALGGPVLSAITGRASRTRTRADRAGGKSRAGEGGVDRRHQAAPLPRRADPPAVDVGTEQEEQRRRHDVAMRTLIAVTTVAVPARERNSDPGMTQRITAIATTSVAPAKAVVRPAVRRVRRGGLQRLHPRRQLLAEARDHQQGVVDAERQPHHRRHGQGEAVDPELAGGEGEHATGGEHRRGAEEQRDRRRDRRAEDEEQDQQQERDRDQLGGPGRVDRFVLDRPREGRVPGLRRADRRPYSLRQDPVQPWHPVLDRILGVEVKVGENQRLARRRPQPLQVPPSQGESVVAPGSAAQPPNEPRPLTIEGGGGAAKQDRERSRVAEVLPQAAPHRAPSRCPALPSEVGRSFPSTPIPSKPSTTTTTKATTKVTRGCRRPHRAPSAPLPPSIVAKALQAHHDEALRLSSFLSVESTRCLARLNPRAGACTPAVL